MTILTLQRRIHEVGRIRAGEKGDRGQPTKLDSWRLTSPQQHLITAAAEIYGGTPAAWKSPTGQEWEVVTEADALNVIVPPTDMAFSQFFESWTGGGCALRCDGVRELIGDQPCVCDPDDRTCKPTTRLSVILPELPGFGVWRVESKGFYSASELAAAVDLLQRVQTGGLVPAELRLVERVIKRPGQQTRRFKTVTLDARLSAAQLMGATAIDVEAMAGVEALAALGDGAPAAPLTPVPKALPTGPTGTVAEQAAKVDQAQPKKKRRGAAPPITPTGLAPRTAAQAAAEVVREPTSPPSPAEPDPWRMTDAQRAKLMASLSDAGVDDELRHQLVGYITKGRATSSTEVQRFEFDALLWLAERIAAGEVLVDYDRDGSLLVSKSPAGGGGPVQLDPMLSHFAARAT